MDLSEVTDEEMQALEEAFDQQLTALRKTYVDYCYWRDNHATLHYAIRSRRSKAWSTLKEQSVLQSVVENA